MPYEIAAHAGYCAGVRQAMEAASAAARDARAAGIPCYSLGELIHNPDAVEALRRAGVIPITSVDQAQCGMILLRSHGVAPEVIAACREKGVLVIKAKDKLRLLPALNIPMDQLAKAVAVIKECCAG